MTCGMSPATLSSMGRRASHSQPGRGRALSRAVDSAAILETAAVVSHLDLIVTVDTMVPHLPGALSRPGQALLHSRPIASALPLMGLQPSPRTRHPSPPHANLH